MSVERPGIAFEKAVATIQAQIDPAATVTHNELLVDRLGHSRQFDIVIRGTFAGQQMLGVIECKDLKRKVGNPEVDAFVTKAQDINANFKMIMSRQGFTKPALAKCSHYGVQALSLLSTDPVNRKFFIGTRWEADLIRWGQIAVTLRLVNEPSEPVHFSADELTIGGKRVLDWFTNYLLDKEDEITELGWVVGIGVAFDKPQSVSVRPGESYSCTAMEFSAERVCVRYERLVGVSGTGFFNWNNKQATFPPGMPIESDAVPMDFSQWQPRSDASIVQPGFMNIWIRVRSVQFERIPDAIELDIL